MTDTCCLAKNQYHRSSLVSCLCRPSGVAVQVQAPEEWHFVSNRPVPRSSNSRYPKTVEWGDSMSSAPWSRQSEKCGSAPQRRLRNGSPRVCDGSIQRSRKQDFVMSDSDDQRISLPESRPCACSPPGPHRPGQFPGCPIHPIAICRARTIRPFPLTGPPMIQKLYRFAWRRDRNAASATPAIANGGSRYPWSASLWHAISRAPICRKDRALHPDHYDPA